MKKICLDSTFLISYLRGNELAEKKISKLKSEGFIFYTTSINVYEIFYGYFRAFGSQANTEKEFTQIKNLFSVLMVYSLNLNSAIRASSIQLALEKKGEVIGINDIVIAAIVLENGNKLLTDNIKHFKRIKGLELIS